MKANDAIAVLQDEGCPSTRRWSNGPGDRYGRHDHPYHKVLFCLEGSIVFHLEDRDVELMRATGSTCLPEPPTRPPSDSLGATA